MAKKQSLQHKLDRVKARVHTTYDVEVGTPSK
jgi:hypothetical protein